MPPFSGDPRLPRVVLLTRPRADMLDAGADRRSTQVDAVDGAEAFPVPDVEWVVRALAHLTDLLALEGFPIVVDDQIVAIGVRLNEEVFFADPLAYL